MGLVHYNYQCYRVVSNYPNRELALKVSDILFSKKLIYHFVLYPVTSRGYAKEDACEEFVLEVLTIRGCVAQIVDSIKSYHPDKNPMISSRIEYNSAEVFNTMKQSVDYPKMSRWVLWTSLFMGFIIFVVIFFVILSR